MRQVRVDHPDEPAVDNTRLSISSRTAIGENKPWTKLEKLSWTTITIIIIIIIIVKRKKKIEKAKLDTNWLIPLLLKANPKTALEDIKELPCKKTVVREKAQKSSSQCRGTHSDLATGPELPRVGNNYSCSDNN